MSHTRLNDRSADAIRSRYRTFLDAAFMLNIRHEQMPGADERIAYAAEFAAYRLVQIAAKLASAIEIMERSTDQPSWRKGRPWWLLRGKHSKPAPLSGVPRVLLRQPPRADCVCHKTFPCC